jgi:hypothetical protein
MPENTVDNKKPAEEGASLEPRPDAPEKKPRKAKFFLIAVLLVAAALGAYKLGWLSAAIRTAGGNDAKKVPQTAFTKSVEGNLISAAPLLEDVGRSPIDPSKVLFPTFNKPIAPDTQEKPAACPTGSKDVSGAPPAIDAGDAAPGESPSNEAAGPVKEGGPTGTGPPALAEKPVIVSRGPVDGKGPQKKTGPEESKAQAMKPEAGGEKKESAPKAPEGAGTPKGPVAGTAGELPSLSKLPSEPLRAKEPSYELPGSLTVKIRNYKGSTIKWGLMVILDDSASMGRKTKAWNPNRVETAVNLVGKLPEALTPGSKLAIRDFTCGSSTKKGGFCLSHTLFDWSQAPFKELKDKLATLKNEGRNNPCAAAAYAIKKDLGGLGDLVPRILVITNGLTKCSYFEVVKAVNSRSEKKKPIVDVIGVGMGPRHARGYSSLAERTGGVFLRAERPSDLDKVLGRYGKILKTKEMEKIEVRGEKAVLTAALEEEIPLTPGTYRVVLPLVGKLNPSYRSIPDVKIDSRESKIIVVRIKNGRPTVKIGKK